MSSAISSTEGREVCVLGATIFVVVFDFCCANPKDAANTMAVTTKHLKIVSSFSFIVIRLKLVSKNKALIKFQVQ
jgi:hypothetical protein